MKRNVRGCASPDDEPVAKRFASELDFGIVKNRDVFVEGPRDGFTPVPKSSCGAGRWG
jgi:hypothetical protein